MTAVAVPIGLRVRDATDADNAALIGLAAACTMQGHIALRVERGPEFFALNRLEGEAWRVGVATNAAGHVLGCVAIARRLAYVNGSERPIAYVSDLKVHPTARGSGAADLLTQYACETAAELCGASAPLLATILAGNAAMENRARTAPRASAVTVCIAGDRCYSAALGTATSPRPSCAHGRHE